MTPTLYAAFSKAADAEAAASALLDRGVEAKGISLVVNDSQREEAEMNAEEGLNPAQNDYPLTEDKTELSSAPASSLRMYNEGLETKEYNAGYDRNVERENERQRAREDASAAEHDSTVPPDSTVHQDAAVNHELDEAGVSRPTIPTVKTTVAASAGLGLGVGALAAVAAITIPGFGLVLGGGALASAVAGLAASSATGASAEGIVGYLKDQGVDADAIPKLRAAYESGGAILAVALDSSPADRIELESIVNSFGAKQVGVHGEPVTKDLPKEEPSR
jgi:hypothetical protein